MPALSNLNPTLLDQIKRTNPDGAIARIVEALTQRNPILMDAMAQEGNLPTGHRTTVRSGLPTVSWRRFNQGIDASKSTTVQVDEACGMLNGRSEVDCSLAKLNGNETQFRASEDVGFLQALNNEVASTVFYGSTKATPEKFHGLTPRYSDSGAPNADNVVLFDGFTDTGVAPAGNDGFSIWFVTWGPDTTFLIYPKGSQAGIVPTDMGKQYVEDADGKKFLAYVTDWEWQLGLCVKDWRYVVRVANIDPNSIDPSQVNAASQAGIINALIEAYHRIHDLNAGRTVMYCNRTVLTWIDRTIVNKSNILFAPVDWHGRQVPAFRGIPIMPCDALKATETTIS